MADTKITALAAITTVDPAADVLPIVDISDTSMAASGTTKKITTNQLLGSGGIATLASATITGDLTVDTNVLKVDTTLNRVGVLNTPTVPFEVTGLIAASSGAFQAGAANGIFAGLNNDGTNPGLDLRRWTGSANNHGTAYIATSSSGDALFYTDAQASNTKATSLRMTLNSTGLGVGAVPSGNNQLTVRSSGAGTEMTVSLGRASAEGIIGIAAATNGFVTGSVAGDMVVRSIGKLMLFNNSANSGITIDASGNLLVGNTTAPAYAAFKANVTGGIQMTGSSTGTAIVSRDGTDLNAYISLGSSFGIANSYDIGLAIANIAAAASKQIKIVNRTGGVYLADGATSWTAVSDERFKDIIEPITNAVSKVGSLRSVIGKFKTDAEGTRRSFLIAQDVQSVMPEAVDASKSDKLGVAYTDVIPLLVAAIKELTAEVNALKNA
jgi:hypothetical protein